MLYLLTKNCLNCLENYLVMVLFQKPLFWDDLLPLRIGTRKIHATALITIFTYERKSVIARAVENAFQLAAFLEGLPAQEYCIVTHQRMSIKMVKAFNNSN
jgi:hypothetical protein